MPFTPLMLVWPCTVCVCNTLVQLYIVYCSHCTGIITHLSQFRCMVSYITCTTISAITSTYAQPQNLVHLLDLHQLELFPSAAKRQWGIGESKWHDVYRAGRVLLDRVPRLRTKTVGLAEGLYTRRWFNYSSCLYIL